MAEPCMTEFNLRIARIEKARAKGYGFEAEGTLGRSTLTWAKRRKPAKRRMLRSLFIVLCCATLIKALFVHHYGVEAYNQRVAGFIAGQGFDRISGALMQAGPVTRGLADGIGRFDPA